MKVLLFGANGMLGSYIYTYLKKTYNVIKITRNDYNVMKNSVLELESIVESSNANYIVNCLGLIPQSQKNGISTSNRDYFKINSIFPNLLSLLANKYNIKMIHITTDCVFNGEKGNYNENDSHDEKNDYGVSKSLGEPDNCCIIRTSIIGEELRNKRSLLEWVKSNKNGEINGYTNHFWNGLTCLELAKIVDKMISEKILWKGVRHIFSPQSVSKYELVSAINDIYKLNIRINPVKCDKTVDKTLSNIYDIVFKIKDINTQIKELREYKFL